MKSADYLCSNPVADTETQAEHALECSFYDVYKWTQLSVKYMLNYKTLFKNILKYTLNTYFEYLTAVNDNMMTMCTVQLVDRMSFKTSHLHNRHRSGDGVHYYCQCPTDEHRVSTVPKSDVGLRFFW